MQNNNNVCCEPSKILTIFAAVIIAIGAVYLGILSWNAIKAHDYIGITAEQRYSITVTGEGEVVAAPDIAKIELGYIAEKKTVVQAQKDNTDKMNAVIKKLKEDFKIDAKDIKTVNYNITPSYDWYDGRRTLKGYQVSQNVSVKIRDLDSVGVIMESAGTLGLNQINGLSFEIDDEEKLKQEARVKALKAAKEKAEVLADAAGVKLGKIISFSESASQPYPIYRANYALEAEGMGGASPEIEAGSTEIKITATVEYEIL